MFVYNFLTEMKKKMIISSLILFPFIIQKKIDNAIVVENVTAELNDWIQEYKSLAKTSHLGATLKKYEKLLDSLCIPKILEEDFGAIVNKSVM